MCVFVSLVNVWNNGKRCVLHYISVHVWLSNIPFDLYSSFFLFIQVFLLNLSIKMCTYSKYLSRLLVDIFVEGPGSSPFEFPRAPSKIWRVPPLKYITDFTIWGVHWALRQNFTRAPLDFQGTGPLPLGPLSALICVLTHWGRVTHICAGHLTIIGSDNGLTPGRHQAITWTNAGLLFIGLLGRNFSEILFRIQTFSFKKMHFKMTSAKWRPFCCVLNVLIMPPTSTGSTSNILGMQVWHMAIWLHKDMWNTDMHMYIPQYSVRCNF